MEVITSSNVETITGKLDSYTGYYLQARRNKNGKVRIFSYRKRGYVPPDGHWRFILMCAEMAHTGLYVSDIIVDFKELYLALIEAHHWVAADSVKKYMIYHARDIINLKITFGL
jgi:hypothetical protein